MRKFVSERAESATAVRIRKMAENCRVAYVPTPRDALAWHITRLTGDEVEFDETEQLLIALQRAGHITRIETVNLQASYLREIKKSTTHPRDTLIDDKRL
jgi:hypothetical protein